MMPPGVLAASGAAHLVPATPLADMSVAWVTTRAAGVTALVASTGSIVLGLLLAGRLVHGRGRLGDARILHVALGIATLAALAVHAGTLLLDPWLRPSLAGILVPFALPYRPVWTGLGVLAGYGLLVAALTGRARGRLGPRWKVLHRAAAATWVLSVAHALGAGSDAGSPWVLLLTLLCVLAVVAAAARRWYLRARAPRARRTGARVSRDRATHPPTFG